MNASPGGTDHDEQIAARVPQLTDDVIVTVTFPRETEEWADDLLRESWMNMDVARDSDGWLVVKATVGGNTSGVAVAKMVLDEIEDALREGNVDPMALSLSVRSVEPNRG